MDVGTIHGSSGWWSHNKWDDVQSASVLLTWAHNSMLISYDPSDLVVVLEHLKEKSNSDEPSLTSLRSSKQCLLCSPSVWWCSHHLNRSRTCARHWERCRLLFLDSLLPVSGDHKSLFLHMSYSSLPKCPSLCLNPLKYSLDHIWIWKIGSNIIKMWFQSILRNKAKQSLGTCNLICTEKLSARIMF